MTSTGFRAFFPTNAPNPLHPILPNMRLNNTDPRSKIEPNFGPFSLPPMVHPVGSQNNQSEDEEVTTSNINSHGANSNFNSETLNQIICKETSFVKQTPRLMLKTGEELIGQ